MAREATHFEPLVEELVPEPPTMDGLLNCIGEIINRTADHMPGQEEESFDGFKYGVSALTKLAADIISGQDSLAELGKLKKTTDFLLRTNLARFVEDVN
jgi:hypothetical protein